MSNYTKLGTLTKIKTGKLDANASSADGIYPFFTCSREPLKINSYSYDCECVLVAGNGELNVKYYKGKFDAYQRTYIIEVSDNNVLLPKYLYYFLDLYVETLRLQSIGGIIKYIKLGNLTEAEIPLFSIEEQQNIVNQLDKCKNLIEQRKLQLQKLDNLVKSQFIEMFGDPENNTNDLPIYKLGDLCTVSSSKRIYQDELTTEGVPFLRVSDLNSKIDYDLDSYELFIPETIYNTLVHEKLVPTENDILITARGTLGKCYIVKSEDKFYFQDGMITWLSHLSEEITRIYLTHLFNMNGIKKQIKELQAGSTVAYLSIAMTKKLNIMLPPLNQQNEFARFVEQTDKSKVLLEKSATILLKLINLVFYLVYIEKSNVLCYNVYSTEEL